ncbi:tape measure protein [Chryseobacterium arachidis]|uniref:tape measure protein n=1 Tax=Chryseobacterium arachidis TaxID=1416778 RepID=UPI00360D02A2
MDNLTSLSNFIDTINTFLGSELSSFARTFFARADLGKAIVTVTNDIGAGISKIKERVNSAFTKISNFNILDGIKETYGKVRDSIKSSYNKLKDHVKASLEAPAPPPTSVRSYRNIQSDIEKTQRSLNRETDISKIGEFRSRLAELQGQADNHPSVATQNAADISRKGGSGFSLAGMLAPLAGIGTMAVGLLKDGAMAALSGGIQKEQDVLSLSNVIGKGQDANAIYKNIATDAGNSPFQLPELLEANKALLSVGGDAQKAREEVMNLANAVTATGGGASELTKLSEQMKDIKSSGKASSDQLKQLEASGIDVYGMLSASTGKGADQFKGGVDYATLSKSFEDAKGKGGLYEGATEKANNTVTGKWDNIKERGMGALTEIGSAFTPIISQVLDIGLKFTEGLHRLYKLYNLISILLQMLSGRLLNLFQD